MLCLLSVMIVLVQAPASVDPGDAEPTTKPTTKPKLQPVVPMLRISGDTKGDSAFKAGVDITRGADDPYNFHTLVPQLEVTLKGGSGILFSRDKDGWRSQGFTLGLVYSHHHTASRDDPEREAKSDRIHREAVALCLARCGDKPAKEDETFCKVFEKEDLDSARLAEVERTLGEESDRQLKKLRDLEVAALRDAKAQLNSSTDASSALRLQIATSMRLRAEDGLFPDTPEYEKLKGLKAEVESLKHSVMKNADNGAGLDDSELCPVGQKHAERERDRTYVGLTDRSVHFGARVGPSALKFLGGEFDADGIEQGPYSEQKETRAVFTLAISAHKLLPGQSEVAGATIEGFFGGGQGWELGQDKVKWCAPVGDVKIDEDTVFAGEVCNEGTFKRPTRSRFLSLGGYLGAVDRARGLWRVAIGGTFSWKNLGSLGADVATKKIATFGVEMPVYVNILSIPKSKDVKSIEYRGLVRLVPRFEYTLDSLSADADLGFLLTLQLLGQRLLFGNALDWF